MIRKRYLKEIKEDDKSKTANMTYSVIINPKIYTKDLTTVQIGIYEEGKNSWTIKNAELIDTYKDNGNKEVNIMTSTVRGAKVKEVNFELDNLSIFSVLIQRKINFPYKFWNLRCIRKEPNSQELVAILDLHTQRTKFVFELG